METGKISQSEQGKNPVAKLSKIISGLGPGLMYAGAAVGVSHLVLSTKAGALFGLEFIPFIILVHIIKYPFLEAGPRYNAATGKNLLQAYQQLGKWSLWLYIIMTFASMFIIQAAVTAVTASLAIQSFSLVAPEGLSNLQFLSVVSAFIIAICSILLITGKFSTLDKLVKAIIFILTITSVIAVLILCFSGRQIANDVPHFTFDKKTHIAFLVAFLGWMPAPMDISIWHSLWAQTHDKNSKVKKTYREAILDFRIGYIGTAGLAICFMLLGAFVMYGSGETFSNKGTVFAGQLISLYREALGPWATPIISLAAFTTMFSTSLTCLDAFPRTLSSATSLLKSSTTQTDKETENKKSYNIWLIATVIGSLLILFVFFSGMGAMVKLATTIAFVSAPIIAILNYCVMRAKDIPLPYQPSKMMHIWNIAGIVLLMTFSIFYIAW